MRQVVGGDDATTHAIGAALLDAMTETIIAVIPTTSGGGLVSAQSIPIPAPVSAAFTCTGIATFPSKARAGPL